MNAFSPAVYVRAHGPDAAERLEAEVDEAVERDMAILRHIHDAVHAALMLVRLLPAPTTAYVAGHEYGDYVKQLAELLPDLSAAAEAELRERIWDKARAEEMI